MIRGLEHLLCEEKLKELGLSVWRRDLIYIYKYLMGEKTPEKKKQTKIKQANNNKNKEERARLISAIATDRARGND